MTAATRYAALAVASDWEDAEEAVHILKAYCGNAAAKIAGESLQMHGGIGFTWEHDLHLYLRRVKANQTIYGEPDWHYERLMTLIAVE